VNADVRRNDTMRHCRRTLVLGLLAALALAGLAAAAAPQTYTLRFHEGDGDKATYAVSATTTAKFTGPEPTTQKGTVQVDLKCAAEFLGLSPDDTLMVQGEILGGTMKTSLGKQSRTAPVPDSVTNYLLTPRGDVKEMDLASGEPTFVTSIGWIYTPDDAFLIAPFPAHPVKVGESWKTVAQQPVIGGEPGETVEVKYESKLLGPIAYAGRNCLKIQTNSGHLMQESIEAPDGSGRLSAKGRSTRATVWLFDPKEGLVMKADATIKFDITQVLESVTEGEKSAKVIATMDMHSRLTEYNGTKVPAK
jgi:hypothetical protein